MLRFLQCLMLASTVMIAACSTDDDATDRMARVFETQALQAEQRGDYTTAAKHYTGLLRSRGADVRTLGALARAMRLSGRAGEALATIEQVMAQTPLDINSEAAAPLLLEHGKLRLIAGQAAAALPPLTAAADQRPRDWEAPAMLGVALDRLGRFDEADGAYRKALAQFPAGGPGNAELLNNYGLSRALAGRLDEAITLLGRAVTLPDAGPQIRQNLALLNSFRDRSVPAGTPSSLSGLLGAGLAVAAPTTPVGTATPLPAPGTAATGTGTGTGVVLPAHGTPAASPVSGAAIASGVRESPGTIAGPGHLAPLGSVTGHAASLGTRGSPAAGSRSATSPASGATTQPKSWPKKAAGAPVKPAAAKSPPPRPASKRQKAPAT